MFLAYYLREGTFANASPIGYAFVGGLSISVGTYFSGLLALRTIRPLDPAADT